MKRNDYEMPRIDLVEANLWQMIASSPSGISSDNLDMPVEKLF